MQRFGSIIQRFRSLYIHDPEPPAATPLERHGSAGQNIRCTPEPEVDLSLMLANFTGSFGGLPQEIVDEILEYLEDDRRTLRVCSLTCKGLFRSARRIIHRQLCVDKFGLACVSHRRQMCRCEAVHYSRLYTLWAAARCDLARYTRDLTIKVGEEFTPKNLWPHLSQFQMFARLTSLTLRRFSPTPFLPVFDQYFGHLAQQMRSLEFIYPSGPQDNMMYFISQFPNLDDLGFSPFPPHNLDPSKEYKMSSVQSSPALRGTLRVSTTNDWDTNSLECLTRLPSGLRFRSIEFLRCTRINPDIIIQECTSTLQSLTHVLHALFRFDLSACSRLQTFELRLEPTLPSYDSRTLVLWLVTVIRTIASPVFSRFILVVDVTNFKRLFRTGGGSGWEVADKFLLRLSRWTGMKMVVRGRGLDDTFRDVMEGAFPLMVSAGAFELESNHLSSRTHRFVSSSIV